MSAEYNTASSSDEESELLVEKVEQCLSERRLSPYVGPSELLLWHPVTGYPPQAIGNYFLFCFVCMCECFKSYSKIICLNGYICLNG